MLHDVYTDVSRLHSLSEIILSILKNQAGLLYVRFLDIQNNGFTSIKLESIKKQIIQKKKYELTPVVDRELLFQTVVSKNDEINISIPPGQSLFIPVEFGFDTRGMKKSGLEEADKKSLITEVTDEIFFGIPMPDNLDEISKKKREDLIKAVFTSVKLQPDFIETFQSIDGLNAKIPDRFSVGPLININSVRIEGKDITADNLLNNPRFSMSIYFAYGSCPYLMVYDSEKSYWKELGTVITDRKEVALQGRDIYPLGDTSTKFRIEERDNEITYLDSVSILYINSSGQEQEKYLGIPLLDETDGKYYNLRQGQALTLDIKHLLPKEAKNIRLAINGYYRILEPAHKNVNQLS